MYNHARSLLVNIDGSTSVFSDVPGDELIPPGYKKIALPTYLENIRGKLFGAKPDRAMLNYRAAQLLTLIDSTDLREYITDLDNRLTYVAGKKIPDSFFQPTISDEADSNNTKQTLILLGKPASPDVSGISYYLYQAEASLQGGADYGNLTVSRLNWPKKEVRETLYFENGLSQAVSLPYSGYSIKFREANLPTTGGSGVGYMTYNGKLENEPAGLTLEQPALFTIKGFLRPSNNFSSILSSLNNIGEPYLLQLFGTDNEEPFRTFKNCWANHPDFAYRLAGIVLAVIYRTEVLRNG